MHKPHRSRNIRSPTAAVQALRPKGHPPAWLLRDKILILNVMAISLKNLIETGKGLKSMLKYVPSGYNVIRTYPVYEFDHYDEYYTWKEVSLRFLQMYYPSDATRFVKYSEDFEKHHFTPMYLSNMIGVLEACDALPSDRVQQLNSMIGRDEELASVLELEKSFLSQDVDTNPLAKVRTFHAWHAAACVLFDKWFYSADSDWIKFQEVEGDGNGYVLNHEYNRIYSSYMKLLARLRDGRNLKGAVVARYNEFPVKEVGNHEKINVFISYAHADEKWLERLKTHLKVMTKYYSLEFWEDTKLRGGDKWREEISSAIKRANVAILLVSTSFLASDFISNNELPPILRKAEEEGTRILPVIVSPCVFEDSELSIFQAVNSPDKTLTDLANDEAAIERVFLALNDCIKGLLNR